MSEPVSLEIVPVAKPRMVASDRWKGRPAVEQYWAFKDELNYKANAARYVLGERLHIKFYIPMPKSWSKKRRDSMAGTPHRGRPDIDNLTKAFLDSLADEDCAIWDIRAQKFWAERGRIEISAIED